MSSFVLHSLPVVAALTLPLLQPAPPQAGLPTGVVTLVALRYRARPLLIFAPTPEGPQMVAQLRILNDHEKAVADRDVLPVAVPLHSSSWSSPPTAASLSGLDADAARRRFHVPPNAFVVILLGKDGGEKLRATRPLSIERLNETIDAMPMRQDEMRTQSR